MLKIDELQDFGEAFKQENEAIKKVLFLVDEDDYSKFVKSELNEDDQANLIIVLPSANIDFKDKDNFQFVNYLHFFIVKKISDRGGYQKYFDSFVFTQPLILQLFDFIKNKTGDFQECTFKDFDLGSTSIDPVTEFARTYGFSLSIPLKTKP
ncbi:hypothetical protein [Tenacibaculum finnmarkense]|uniref:hypothetical protein n=1 Tax=Tenacibaculum finnmarkense TaxID=2781243 RepID=UPI00187B9B9B|nr:hypothetical protein [Tenacibaculum finnmarkense]MBE7649161.1 hypothetical protein [Tenacibaculum finnmarkense genomovar ulcerans]